MLAVVYCQRAQQSSILPILRRIFWKADHIQGKTAQEQQAAVIAGFPAVPAWFRKLFPYSKWGAEVNAWITPTFFKWGSSPTADTILVFDKSMMPHWPSISLQGAFGLGKEHWLSHEVLSEACLFSDGWWDPWRPNLQRSMARSRKALSTLSNVGESSLFWEPQAFARLKRSNAWSLKWFAGTLQRANAQACVSTFARPLCKPFSQRNWGCLWQWSPTLKITGRSFPYPQNSLVCCTMLRQI